jgi:hypothetical protein
MFKLLLTLTTCLEILNVDILNFREYTNFKRDFYIKRRQL